MAEFINNKLACKEWQRLLTISWLAKRDSICLGKKKKYNKKNVRKKEADCS